MPAAVEGCAVFAVDCPVRFGVAQTVAATSAAAGSVDAERPVAFHSAGVSAVGCPATFRVAERVAADCSVRLLTFHSVEVFASDCPAFVLRHCAAAAECPPAFHFGEAFSAGCPGTFDAAEIVGAGCPVFVLRPSAFRSVALHHRTCVTSHHQLLTDCQRSENIRSTAAAATNQLSW